MDILFFAALAFFIFYKLSKHLGKVDEEEKRQIDEKLIKMRLIKEQVVAQMKQQEKIIEEKIVGSSSTNAKPATDTLIATLSENLQQNLTPILQRCNITTDSLIENAKNSFESVLKAFAAGDIAKLKTLLTDNILKEFEIAINQRQAEKQIITTNLISIKEAEIVSVITAENTAIIAIKFVSKQINYISDNEGKIIFGRKDEINEITDTWTFKRDLTSSSPEWLISSTNFEQ